MRAGQKVITGGGKRAFVDYANVPGIYGVDISL